MSCDFSDAIFYTWQSLLDINFVAVRSPPQVKFNSLKFMHKNISSRMICVNVKHPRFR